MMDYYSSFPMPDLETRKASLHVYAKNINLTHPNLDELITTICKSTEVFSLTGYSVFGQNEEQKKLKEKISESVKSVN